MVPWDTQYTESPLTPTCIWMPPLTIIWQTSRLCSPIWFTVPRLSTIPTVFHKKPSRHLEEQWLKWMADSLCSQSTKMSTTTV
jgi:hypothetical protein